MNKMYIKIALYTVFSLIILKAAFAASLLLLWTHDTPTAPGRTDLEQNATGYAVYKDNKRIGTLIGSFHLQLNPAEQESFQYYFKKELHNHNALYTEIPLIHMAHTGGVESTLYSATTSYPNISCYHFETLDQQQAMLSRSVIVFDHIAHLNSSFSWMQKHPNLAQTIHNQVLSMQGLANTAYNFMSDNATTKFLIAKQSFEHNQMIESFKAYQQGKAIILPPIDSHMYCMDERDALYSNTLLNVEDGWIAVIGFSHLAGTNSITDQLIQAGYKLKGFNFYQEALSSL